MKITDEAKQLAEKTKDAYSFYVYNSWPAVIQSLIDRGYNKIQIEAIVRSKWMRFASDNRKGKYATSEDLRRWMVASKISKQQLADLVAETFPEHVTLTEEEKKMFIDACSSIWGAVAWDALGNSEKAKLPRRQVLDIVIDQFVGGHNFPAQFGISKTKHGMTKEQWTRLRNWCFQSKTGPERLLRTSSEFSAKWFGI